MGSDIASQTSPPPQVEVYSPSPGLRYVTLHLDSRRTIPYGRSGPPPTAITTKAWELYFERCHRQPIWCFDCEETSEPQNLDDELACTIMALTAQFVPYKKHLLHYLSKARSLIMLRIANGSVRLGTIESLCLLSYCFFLGMLCFGIHDLSETD